MYSPRFSEVVPPYTFMMEGLKWECPAQNTYDAFAFRLYQRLFLPLLNNKSNLFDITKTHLIMYANRLTTQNGHKHEANHLLLVAVLKLGHAIG